MLTRSRLYDMSDMLCPLNALEQKLAELLDMLAAIE